MSGMRLVAGSTVVREWEEADAEPVTPQANDRRVWRGLRDAFPHPYAIEDAGRFIAMAREMSPRTYFAIEVVPYASNAASARVLEKAGYTLEGTLRQSAIKDGQVLDQWMYAIVRE